MLYVVNLGYPLTVTENIRTHSKPCATLEVSNHRSECVEDQKYSCHLRSLCR